MSDFVSSFRVKNFPNLLLWTGIDQFDFASSEKFRSKLKNFYNCLFSQSSFSRGLCWQLELTCFLFKSAEDSTLELSGPLSEHTMSKQNPESGFCFARIWFWDDQPTPFFLMVPKKLSLTKFFEKTFPKAF